MHFKFLTFANKNLSISDNTAPRRNFLKARSLAFGATLRRPLTAVAQVGPTQFFARKKAGNPKRILVIGAGLAGLTAAYELTQAGHNVIVLRLAIERGDGC